MTDFKPTHKIVVFTPRTGKSQTWPVMLVNSVGYTFAEWTGGADADWELVDGQWRFQGDAAPWNGTVTVTKLIEPSV